MSSSYDERIVAFVDILAFTNLVTRLESDDGLHSKLVLALKQIGTYKQIAGKAAFAQKNLEVSVFSDSIVISAKPEHLLDVIWSCLGLQSQLLALGILTRGGVSIGKTTHEDDILFGEGMIRAYRLESGAAIYPRIIIDPSIMQRFSRWHRRLFLTEDHDGLWFVDPFADGILPPGSEALLEDGWDPNHVALVELGKHISIEIAATSDANHLMKWRWLERQRILAINYLETNRMPRIFHLMKQSEQDGGGNRLSPVPLL